MIYNATTKIVLGQKGGSVGLFYSKQLIFSKNTFAAGRSKEIWQGMFYSLNGDFFNGQGKTFALENLLFQKACVVLEKSCRGLKTLEAATEVT